MNRFIEREFGKRQKSVTKRRYAMINWQIQKKMIYNLLANLFEERTLEGKYFVIDKELDDPLFGKKHVGYDCVQLSFPTRPTGNIIYDYSNSENSVKRHKECGAAIAFTSSAVGIFNVFFKPSVNDDRLVEPNDLLIFTSRDPLDLSPKLVIKLVSQFLVFQRVDSLMESSSILDRVKVARLYFKDARNREKYRSLVFKITNHWGAVVVSGLLAWLIAK